MLYICTRIRRRGTSFEGTTTLSRKLDPSPTSKSRYLAAFIFARRRVKPDGQGLRNGVATLGRVRGRGPTVGLGGIAPKGRTGTKPPAWRRKPARGSLIHGTAYCLGVLRAAECLFPGTDCYFAHLGAGECPFPGTDPRFWSVGARKCLFPGTDHCFETIGAVNCPPARPNYFTIPLKPIKARARIPTLTKAIGTPLNALGTSLRARCSRIPAKITIARP